MYVLETALHCQICTCFFIKTFVWIGRKCWLNRWMSGLVLFCLVLSCLCMSVWWFRCGILGEFFGAMRVRVFLKNLVLNHNVVIPFYNEAMYFVMNTNK